jgi:hypothetical protein
MISFITALWVHCGAMRTCQQFVYTSALIILLAFSLHHPSRQIGHRLSIASPTVVHPALCRHGLWRLWDSRHRTLHPQCPRVTSIARFLSRIILLTIYSTFTFFIHTHRHIHIPCFVDSISVKRFTPNSSLHEMPSIKSYPCVRIYH